MARRLLLFLAVLTASGYTQSLVQQKPGSGLTGTLTSTPTAGNVLIAVIASNRTTNPQQAVTAITETNVTWVAIAAAVFVNGATNHSRVDVWWGVVGSSASTSITITMSQVSSESWNFQEWSGLSTVTQPDTFGGVNQNSSGSPTLPSISTRASGDLVIASVVVTTASTVTADPGAPYTSLSAPVAWSHSSFYTNGSGPTTASNWTQNGTLYGSIVVTFFATGAGPPTGPVNPLVLLGVGN